MGDNPSNLLSCLKKCGLEDYGRTIFREIGYHGITEHILSFASTEINETCMRGLWLELQEWNREGVANKTNERANLGIDKK